MDWLTTLIDREFNGKFSFLKLLDVVYNKENKQCLITFLYPENKVFSDENKEEVTKFIKKKLELNAKITIKFRKSFLDDELIERNFFTLLKTEYPSIYALSKSSLKIEKDFNNINIKFKMEKTSAEYINEDEFKTKLKNLLELKFCCEFSINLEKIEIEFNEIENIKTKNADNVFSQKTPRYEVQIVKKIFGKEICPKPEFIKNIKGEKTSVILAGKIENIEKKSYESKKQKTKGQTKHYYCFELNDSINRIDVKYFTPASNEKKMDTLKNGDEVLIIGDVRSFNNKLSLYIKEISFCKLPEKIEIPVIFSNEYEYTKPEVYSVLSQANLFKKQIKYIETIYSNSYVVFDVETTGLNYETEELLEIGAVKIQDGKIISKFATLIKPKSPIPHSATLINNITDSMVANSPKVEVAIRDFYRFSRGAKLVGYNVGFDQKFIQKAAKDQGLFFDNEFVDVLPLARAKLRMTRYKLTDVVKRLQIELEGAHRALADSLATAEVFLELNSVNYA
ncbi:MAG: exonuclease domain-containing protein [Clostridia bacterium]|nr:exonuclease domain-containing protein [Clostridia bacterium]